MSTTRDRVAVTVKVAVLMTCDVLQVAVYVSQLQEATDEVEELYSKNEDLETALKQLASKLDEVDKQLEVSRAKEQELVEEKEALVSSHVAANAEKNQRIEELSSVVRASLCLGTTWC